MVATVEVCYSHGSCGAMAVTYSWWVWEGTRILEGVAMDHLNGISDLLLKSCYMVLLPCCD